MVVHEQCFVTPERGTVMRILVYQSFEVEAGSTTQEAYHRCGSLGTMHHMGFNPRWELRSRRPREPWSPYIVCDNVYGCTPYPTQHPFGLDDDLFPALYSASRLLCPIPEDASRDRIEAEAACRAGGDRPEQLLYDRRYLFIHNRVFRA
jgi:hypothetical protein